MCDKKNSVLFTETECLILSPSFKLLDESQVVLRAPRKDDVYILDLKNIVPSRGLGNQLNHNVKILRCDNGTEFKNHAMNKFCAKKRIKREFSVARTPQQNGVVERKNRTLINAARTMLVDSLLSIPFWAEAVNTACYDVRHKGLDKWQGIDYDEVLEPVCQDRRTIQMRMGLIVPFCFHHSGFCQNPGTPRSMHYHMEIFKKVDVIDSDNWHRSGEYDGVDIWTSKLHGKVHVVGDVTLYTSTGINLVRATNPKALSDGLRFYERDGSPIRDVGQRTPSSCYPITTPTSINSVGISGTFESSGRIPHIKIIDFSSRREGQDTQEELEKRDLKAELEEHERKHFSSKENSFGKD
ncbi:putative ribonuclease H-like domain-containing protein [Tanacetum coccineum]